MNMFPITGLIVKIYKNYFLIIKKNYGKSEVEGVY